MHNGKKSKAQVQSGDEEQAIHNGLSLAEYYHKGEEIKYISNKALSGS